MQPLTNDQVTALTQRGGGAAAKRFNQLIHKVSTNIASAAEKRQVLSLKASIDQLIGRVDDEVMRLTQLKKENKTISFTSPVVEGDTVAVVPSPRDRDAWYRNKDAGAADVVITADEMLWVMRQPKEMRQDIMRSVHIAFKALDGEMVLT